MYVSITVYAGHSQQAWGYVARNYVFPTIAPVIAGRVDWKDLKEAHIG